MILWIGARLVPEPLRAAWLAQWRDDLWRWILREAEASVPGSHSALIAHARGAFSDAFRVRFLGERAREERRRFLGDPRVAVGAGALLLLTVAAASGGFSFTRQVLRGLPYPNPERVVVLAQGAPTFGARFGFRGQEIQLFRAKSQTLVGVAEYTWYTRSFATASSGNARPVSVLTSSVGPRFFPLLGVDRETPGPGEFLASNKFWRTELQSDPAAIGHSFAIDGRPLKLVGVLPEAFSFLSAPIAIWTAESAEMPPALPPPPRQWWRYLKGVVARLNAGVSADAAEKELHGFQVQAGIARRNFQIHATPIGDLVFQSISSYGSDLAMLSVGILLLAAIRAWIDRRRGVSWKIAARFWGFFIAKTVLPVLALFFSIFEFGGAGRLGMTGGAPDRGGPLLAWGSFACVVLILFWAWRDQPNRCRVCLHRMHRPVRIGVPGLILLDTSGEEVMCPRGHGSVYTAESVLGADFSDRWMGVENLFSERVRHVPGEVLGIGDREE
jgi:MacB-like periplasmic core domain